MRPAALALALASSLALAAPGRAQQPAPPAPTPEEVPGLLATLSTGDDTARRDAFERLSRLGAERKDELRRHLADDDPQVRFHVLALLAEADAAVEQRVRVIVEGRPGFAGTYPEALEARAALLGLPDVDVADRLVRVVRRRADRSDRGTRYATVALDLLADRLRLEAARGVPATVELTTAMAQLCELDLSDAFHDLADAFAEVPPDRGHPALRAVIAGGSPLGRARAARVLAEVADPAHAQAAARAILPLLAHASSEVRLAALRALDVLPLAPQDMVPAAALAQDQDAAVAEAALRIAGQRRLTFAREAAERAAADAGAPGHLRQQAVRTLGLLGVVGSADVLRPLCRQDDRDLAVLAAWSLGAMKAPDAQEQLLALIGTPDIADERLFNGLARLGAPRGVETLESLLLSPAGAPRAADGGPLRAPRPAMIQALGFARPEGAVDLLVRVLHEPRAGRMSDEGTTNNEVEVALRALHDQRSEEARVALATLLVESIGRGDALVEELVPMIGDLGPPGDRALSARLSLALERCLAFGGNTRDAAAMALVFVDPARARAVLARFLANSGQPPEVQHALARAGDPGPTRARALPAQRQKRDAEADPTKRIENQNLLGIELLYADLLQESDLEFRRMLWCRPRDDTAAYNIACGHALGGRTEAALRALRRAARNGFDRADHMAADTDLRSIRDDPRYQRLIEGMVLDTETGMRTPVDRFPGRR